ncbi:sensor histidine kinase [Actinomycetospora chiangmaiensis]|uniref:sensor histidine kinase n=1 Tax=Actinomycetospora chiangmaiensis TaxID=402650 RepID=UPI00036FDA56|nr:histidine kinase [Actinomycetospora chiangmaiensis]
MRTPLRAVSATAARYGVVVLAVAIDLLVWNGERVTRAGAVVPWWLVPAVTAACYAPLLWRFRWPLGSAAPVWLVSCGSLMIPQWQPFTGLLVALHAVASTRPLPVSALSAFAALAPFGLDSYDSASFHSHVDRLVPFLVFATFWVVMTATAWGFGRWSHLAGERSAAEAAAAVRADRLEVARDLHDRVANRLTAMMAFAAVAAREQEADTASGPLAAIETAGRRAMVEMADLLYALREVGSPDGGSRPTSGEGLTEVVAAVQAERGLQVDLVMHGPGGAADDATARVVRRVVEEALVNAAKHGDRDRPVQVQVEQSPQCVAVEVRNVVSTSGCGGAAPTSFGWGLIGLGERVEVLGGSLVAQHEGDTFVLRVDLPADRPRDPPDPAIDLALRSPADA